MPGGREVVEDSGAARSEVGGNGPAAPVARKMMEAALAECERAGSREGEAGPCPRLRAGQPTRATGASQASRSTVRVCPPRVSLLLTLYWWARLWSV